MAEFNPTFGEMRQGHIAELFGSFFGPPGKHDDKCESKFVIEYAPSGPHWTECLCHDRRLSWLDTQPRIRVWKETDRGNRYYRMWRGACRKCGKTTQFWFFGATLGQMLEHQRRCIHD